MATAKKKAKPAAKSAAKRPAAKKSKPAAKKQSASAQRTNTKRSGGSSGNGFEDYSGKFTVRLPRSLHQALVDRAEKEGVSLNLFVTNALSRTVAGSKK
jgi:predicted HicB family RNase H-like nuclease